MTKKPLARPKKTATKRVGKDAKRTAKRSRGPATTKQASERKASRPGLLGETERIAVRRRKALAARVRGATFRQIADENTVSVGTAYEDVAAEMTAVCARTRMDAKLIRDLALERCDLAIRGLWKAVLTGDPAACRVWIRAIELQAKLNGLLTLTHPRSGDAPPGDTLTEREIAFRVDALLKFAKEEHARDKARATEGTASRAAKRALGPKAAKQASERSTSRPRPPAPPGEAERIAVRRGKALAARVEGANFRQIADENNVSVGTAYEDVAAEMTAVCARTRLEAELLRDLALERCDLALRGLRPAVLKGDPPACRVWIRTVELSAKLNGIITPTDVRPSDEDDSTKMTEREIAFRVEALVELAKDDVVGDHASTALSTTVL